MANVQVCDRCQQIIWPDDKAYKFQADLSTGDMNHALVAVTMDLCDQCKGAVQTVVVQKIVTKKTAPGAVTIKPEPPAGPTPRTTKE